MVKLSFPIHKIEHRDFYTRDFYYIPYTKDWYECEDCHRHILKWYKFCPHCGSLIDWNHMKEEERSVDTKGHEKHDIK